MLGLVALGESSVETGGLQLCVRKVSVLGLIAGTRLPLVGLREMLTT